MSVHDNWYQSPLSSDMAANTRFKNQEGLTTKSSNITNTLGALQSYLFNEEKDKPKGGDESILGVSSADSYCSPKEENPSYIPKIDVEQLDPPIKLLTWDEMASRMEKDLCYTCDERFTLSHRCKNIVIYLLMTEEEERHCLHTNEEEQETDSIEEVHCIDAAEIENTVGYQAKCGEFSINTNLVPIIDIPRFDGSDLGSWMIKCEAYFKLNPNIPDQQRVVLASRYFEGRAASFYQHLLGKQLKLTLTVFLKLIAARFEDIKETKVMGEFNKLKLLGKYSDIVDRFEELKVWMLLDIDYSEECSVASLFGDLSEEFKVIDPDLGEYFIVAPILKVFCEAETHTLSASNVIFTRFGAAALTMTCQNNYLVECSKTMDFGWSTLFELRENFADATGNPYYVTYEILCESYCFEINACTADVILYILLSGILRFWAEVEQWVFEQPIHYDIDSGFDLSSSILDKAMHRLEIIALRVMAVLSSEIVGLEIGIIVKGCDDIVFEFGRMEYICCSYMVDLSASVNRLDWIGEEIHSDIICHHKIRNFRIRKQLLFMLFNEKFANEFSISVRSQRLWLWAKRQNHTFRPSWFLIPCDAARVVEALREAFNKVEKPDFKLLLRVDQGLKLEGVNSYYHGFCVSRAYYAWFTVVISSFLIVTFLKNYMVTGVVFFIGKKLPELSVHLNDNVVVGPRGSTRMRNAIAPDLHPWGQGCLERRSNVTYLDMKEQAGLKKNKRKWAYWAGSGFPHGPIPNCHLL